MAKRQLKAPPFTRGEIHFIKDEYATRYRVWQSNWNGQLDLMSYDEFAQLKAVADKFNAIDLIDHTDED